VAAVAATYVYFLIFAQFGFLQAVQNVTGGVVDAVRPIMAVMGFCGIAGSALAAWWFAEQRSRRQLAVGFGLCAAAAGLSLVAKTTAGFYGVAALVGLGTGLVTVMLAGMLRTAVGDRQLGLIIGLGTGLAYAFCNLPAVFAAGAATQAQLALGATALGLAAGWRLVPTVLAAPPAGPDYRWRRGLGGGIPGAGLPRQRGILCDPAHDGVESRHVGRRRPVGD
jgi:hypothetical protein